MLGRRFADPCHVASRPKWLEATVFGSSKKQLLPRLASVMVQRDLVILVDDRLKTLNFDDFPAVGFA